jgi:hypothetical protein
MSKQITKMPDFRFLSLSSPQSVTFWLLAFDRVFGRFSLTASPDVPAQGAPEQGTANKSNRLRCKGGYS